MLTVFSGSSLSDFESIKQGLCLFHVYGEDSLKVSLDGKLLGEFTFNAASVTELEQVVKDIKNQQG